MAIKKQDGTEFHLKKPNPIMKFQNTWHYSLYNFDTFEEKSFLCESKFTPLEDIEVQEITVEAKPAIPEPRKFITLYCLPANVVEVKDSLYDENRSAVTFGQQFNFKASIVNQSDLHLQFWQKKHKIERLSIIFVPSQLRWWKVENVTEVGGGFTATCSPSKDQPSFDV